MKKTITIKLIKLLSAALLTGTLTTLSANAMKKQGDDNLNTSQTDLNNSKEQDKKGQNEATNQSKDKNNESQEPQSELTKKPTTKTQKVVVKVSSADRLSKLDELINETSKRSKPEDSQLPEQLTRNTAYLVIEKLAKERAQDLYAILLAHYLELPIQPKTMDGQNQELFKQLLDQLLKTGAIEDPADETEIIKIDASKYPWLFKGYKSQGTSTKEAANDIISALIEGVSFDLNAAKDEAKSLVGFWSKELKDGVKNLTEKGDWAVAETQFNLAKELFETVSQAFLQKGVKYAIIAKLRSITLDYITKNKNIDAEALKKQVDQELELLKQSKSNAIKATEDQQAQITAQLMNKQVEELVTTNTKLAQTVTKYDEEPISDKILKLETLFKQQDQQQTEQQQSIDELTERANALTLKADSQGAKINATGKMLQTIIACMMDITDEIIATNMRAFKSASPVFKESTMEDLYKASGQYLQLFPVVKKGQYTQDQEVNQEEQQVNEDKTGNNINETNINYNSGQYFNLNIDEGKNLIQSDEERESDDDNNSNANEG